MDTIEFLKRSISGRLSLHQQKEFLESKKSLTAEEFRDIVVFLQKDLPEKRRFSEAIDVCGTGGSGLQRINTSTIAAFILASLGVKVAKHGNKAASGRFGSFDLVETLGINSHSSETLYHNHHLALLFASEFYPAMKHFAPVRKSIGKPTFFNLLGPLLSPVRAQKQIIGTAFRDKMEIIAQTCKLLGKKHVFVVCGEDGLDEVTLTGKTYVVELHKNKIQKYIISPKDFGLSSCSFSEIKGGTPKYNVKMTQSILQGKCKTKHLDLVLINVALALQLTGKAVNLKDGYRLAKQAAQEGKAFETLHIYQEYSKTPHILQKIVQHKCEELEKRKLKYSLEKLKKEAPICDRNFIARLQRPRLSLIAEIKKYSPSSPKIASGSFSPTRIARLYEKNGVDAISVLCDQKYFGGSLQHLQKAYEHTKHTPILCKDFIIDEYQIYEARKYGASAVLLIAAILNEDQIKKFLKVVESLKMTAICEVHNREELEKVLKTSAKAIGINNRDLNTFTTSMRVTKKLAPHIPADKILISESGITSKSNIDLLPENIDAVLIGTSFMSSENISEKIHSLFRSQKPLLKICGIRTEEEAYFCDALGIDLIGLNFVEKSHRSVSVKKANIICENITHAKTVGVFQNHKLEEVNKIATALNLDYIQLSGKETLSYVQKCCKPVLKTIPLKTSADIKIAEKYLPHVSYVIFDGPDPGSGKMMNTDLLRGISGKFFLSGGINANNIGTMIQKLHPLGVDIASGAETDLKIDLQKISFLFHHLSPC